MAKTPFIGQLDRKISIISKTISRDSTGGEITSENTICTPFSCLSVQDGSEDVEGKIVHLIKRSYTIRYRADVKSIASELIILDGGVRYNVYHVIEVGRKNYLELLVQGHE